MVDKKKKLIKSTRVRKTLMESGKPRLSVHRTDKHIFAQIIDDKKQVTLAAVSDMSDEIEKGKEKLDKSAIAEKVGELIAKKAAELKIKEVVFDRGYLQYHGRIKALAEGARKAGLIF